MAKNRQVFAIACCLCFSITTAANGQFLEKLENAVRSQLEKATEQPTGDQSSGELPAPSSKGRLPSILETPIVPSPTTQPQASTPEAGNSKQGQIYLGLEAENSTGGGLGVQVTDVTKDSPAWNAGFKVGDRIIAIDGYALANLDTMVERLGKTSPGQDVDFLIQRSGSNEELTAKLMDAAVAAKLRNGEPVVTGGTPWLGVVVSELTPSFRQRFGLRVFRAAAVTEVTSGSPASRAGIRAGDAIVEIDGRLIETGEQVTQVISQAKPGQVLEMMVYRGIAARTYKVTLAALPASERANAKPAATRPAVTPSLINPFGGLFGGPSPNPTAPGPGVPPQNLQQQSQPAAEPTSNSADDPVALKAEIRRLKLELAAAQRKLAETEQRIEKILEALK